MNPRAPQEPYPGLFVVIDGIDGTGKTRIVEKTVRLLEDLTSIPVVSTKEPECVA